MKTIRELAKIYNISTRTLRYYEELGLVNPVRTETNQRLYTKQDEVNLKLVFRGKKFGFSLDEIREMVLLFSLDRTGKKQLEKSLQYGRVKMAEIDQKILELQEIKRELGQIQQVFEEKLMKLEGDDR